MTSTALVPPQPVNTLHLFAPLLDSLLDVLTPLTPEEWFLPTACTGWSVHDVALHLFGDDVGMLSSRRDQHRGTWVQVNSWDELVAAINANNARWVEQTRRISPRLLCDFLRLTGHQITALFHTLDLSATGVPVNWASDNPAPIWLDVAREYTERWHHQQHIREAANRPLLTEPRFLRPVLDTFVHALPRALENVDATDGVTVTLWVMGGVNTAWTLERLGGRWQLFDGRPNTPTAEAIISDDTAWRLFTKGISPDEARGRAELHGDHALASHLFSAVALIA